MFCPQALKRISTRTPAKLEKKKGKRYNYFPVERYFFTISNRVQYEKKKSNTDVNLCYVFVEGE